MTESERKKVFYELENCNIPFVMKWADKVYEASNFNEYFGREISREEALIIAFYLYEWHGTACLNRG